ncbi:MAG: SDR family NAD(P)-dependent oxidoreductase [Epsilonproteobacteria bacterium]|nr:SDR family NAD(P)-dependent oxidoreductase [Campylobacterota bacterium]
MKTVVITGASNGIGKEVAKTLLDMGFFVIGISREVDKSVFNHVNFKAIKCNLSDEKQTLELCNTLKKQDAYILINCAGFGRFEPHEELSYKTIIQMTFLNLTTPMLLSNTLLRTLKKNGGYIININSIEALRASKFAGVYSATKAGLKAFGDSLFEETRKSDLSVININPDMTQSSFYDNLRFDVSTKDDEKLFASDVADAIKHILSMRKGVVVSEYTIRSLKFGITKKRN